MTNVTAELVPFEASLAEAGWWLNGTAKIDYRDAVSAALVIRSDGTWAAEVAIFTLAGEVELYFDSDAGGQFCGPAFVGRSRAGTYPFRMVTELIGTGPLLVVAPHQVQVALPDAEMMEGEVVEE